MKNIYLYYLAIFLPIPLIVWIAYSASSTWFAAAILIYAIPYRTFVDCLRLVDKKVIQFKEFWKLLIPWRYGEFMKELYLIP